MEDNRLKDFVTIEAITIKMFNIVFIAAYKPPKPEININELNTLFTLRDKIIIGGDLNAKHFAWGNNKPNKAGKLIINYLLNNEDKIKIHNSEMPTYHSPINGCISTLAIFMTKNVNLKEPVILNELSSDHIPVLTRIIKNIKIDNDTCKYDYLNTDWKKYKEIINENWSLINEFKDNDDVDITITDMTNKMQHALRTPTPKWTYKNKQINTNDQIKRLLQLRNKIRKNSQKNNCNECKKIVNKITNCIRYKLQKQKNVQISKYLEKLEVKNSSLWNAVRLSKLRGAETKKINEFHSANGIIYDKKEIANAFVDNFERVHYLTENLGFNNNNKFIRKEYNKIVDKNITNSIDEVNSHQVKALIKKLKNKKAPGIDNIINLQLKHSTNKIVVQIMRIFNYCLTNMYFPRVWRVAKTIPLPKPGKDALFPQNYRPISLLSSISKMLEKIIANKIRKFLENTKLITYI